MNNLLLLAGIVLVVCLMNSKDLMNSVSSKSKSVSKSLGVESSTLLVVVFVGAVLFMCMNKRVEGFTGLVNGECPNGTKMHVYDPSIKPSIADKPDRHTPVCFDDEASVFTEIKNEFDKLINNSSASASPSSPSSPTEKPVEPSGGE